jgi:L-ascorbate metabolism protein UlaG (beta-lactamase superfamily)
MDTASPTIIISDPTDPRPSPPDSKAHEPKAGSKDFNNPWPSFGEMAGTMSFLKAKICGEIDPKSIPKNVEELVGSEVPSWETGNKDKIKAMWLGHASCYIELPCKPDQERGVRILFDPVFSERVSPVSFVGPKRFTQAPAQVEDLPEIDMVCISHNHYDHLDIDTLKKLHDRFKDAIHFFVPFKVAVLLKDAKITQVTDMDWWQEKIFKKGDLEARIGYLPAQHFSFRSLCDKDDTLWGSYSIESTSHPEQRIWFAGDTGRRTISKEIEEGLPKTQEELDKLPVCPVHKEIGELRGPFVFAMIPIGAYKPRFLMSCVHVDPGEAISIYQEVGVKRALAIHWGTFALSGEDVMEPKEELERLCKERGVTGFDAWKLGARTEI